MVDLSEKGFVVKRFAEAIDLQIFFLLFRPCFSLRKICKSFGLANRLTTQYPSCLRGTCLGDDLVVIWLAKPNDYKIILRRNPNRLTTKSSSVKVS